MKHAPAMENAEMVPSTDAVILVLRLVFFMIMSPFIILFRGGFVFRVPSVVSTV